MKTTNSRILLCALALSATLIGCASAPPEHHEYLLRPAQAETMSPGQPVVHLQPVSVAPYLDQRGIVLQLSDAEIRVAGQNTWAEPLDDAIARYLQVSIGNRADLNVEIVPLITGAAVAAVTVRISQLHGNENGQVRLVAEWIVEPAGGEPVLFRFDESMRQSADGYAALVAAHAALLDQLAGNIADSLR